MGVSCGQSHEDKEHKVIDRYGILNPDSRGWPHPATFVIDPKGIVRWKFIEVDYKKRASNEQIPVAGENQITGGISRLRSRDNC